MSEALHLFCLILRGTLLHSGLVKAGIAVLESLWSKLMGSEICTMTLDRITSNPAQMNGQPCIRNLRLTVRRVIELLAVYLDRSELRREYPELEDEDIRQALAYAASYLEDRSMAFSV